MYNDQTFIQSAQGLLVREDGKIDGTVLDYLDDVGKERGDGRDLSGVSTVVR